MGTGRDGDRRPRARAALNRERILRAGLAEVDTHGLDALTMQRLAASLGTGAMSLYNHVKNKDDLLDGVSELIWREIAAEAPPRDDPARWLEDLGRAIRDAGHRHPKALSVLVSGCVFPPPLLEVIAEMIERATDDPEPDPKLVNGIATVSAFALGWALTEASGMGPAMGSEKETERQRIRRVTRALPPETPDRLVDAAIAVCASDAEPMFTTGLAAIIAGCGYTTSMTQQSSSPRPASPGTDTSTTKTPRTATREEVARG